MDTVQFHFLPGASGEPKFWLPVAKKLNQPYILQHYPAFSGYPNTENIQNFSELNDWVITQITHPSILIAQSMGGIFAIQAALQKPHLIKAIILCATSGGIDLSKFDIQDWRSDYIESFPQAPTWFINTQINLSPELNKISIPVLLLWGDDDPISPTGIGEFLQHQLIHSQLAIIKNGQHNFANVYADQVADRITQFLKDTLN